MLKFNNVSVTFPSYEGRQKKVLENLTLSINKGEFVIVLGENGAGKSTLLNLASGIIKPTTGAVTLHDQHVHELPLSIRTKECAHVVQDPRKGTVTDLTIFENMVLASKRGTMPAFTPYDTRTYRTFVEEQLASLGTKLEHKLDKPVEHLSGGQRQTLSVVMALINKPQVLLLDEITAALDREAAENLMQLVNKISQETETTILMITHNMKHAIEYGDRSVILAQGKIVEEYGPEEKSKLQYV